MTMLSLTKLIADLKHRRKMRRIRREIRANTYATPHKLDVAADRLLEDITAGMRRELRLDRRLTRRDELRIPWEQEMRARLLTGHTRPRD
jgi:hypothetical protein